MSLRLFAALAIPDDTADRLMPLMKGVPGAKWRPRENLHLTLRFFGEVRETVADDIDAELSVIADRFSPFEVALKGAGSFGGAEPHALYVGAEPSPPLTALAGECERAARRAGLAAEKRKFTPHVTMAYLAGAPLDRVQAFERRLGLFNAPLFRADVLGLYSSWTRKSASNLYRLEAAYPLRG